MSKYHKKIPTDFELLTFIYNHYYEDYESFIKEDNKRNTKIYVPIDCKVIADHFKVDRDIIFGRLYYHLENKYKYQQHDGVWVYFYTLSLGTDIKCINFPYMASVLAELSDKESKYITTVKVSIIAICISLAAMSVTIYDKFATNEQVVIKEQS